MLGSIDETITSLASGAFAKSLSEKVFACEEKVIYFLVLFVHDRIRDLDEAESPFKTAGIISIDIKISEELTYYRIVSASVAADINGNMPDVLLLDFSEHVFDGLVVF